MVNQQRRTWSNPNRAASLDSFRSWPFVPLQWRSDLGAVGGNFAGEAGGEGFTTWTPPVDIVVNEQRYTLAVEFPGARREDVSIAHHDKVLTVKGEKKRVPIAEGDRLHRAERCYGAFERSFRLPADADEEKLEARYRAGVLLIEIPRRPAGVAMRAPSQS